MLPVSWKSKFCAVLAVPGKFAIVRFFTPQPIVGDDPLCYDWNHTTNQWDPGNTSPTPREGFVGANYEFPHPDAATQALRDISRPPIDIPADAEPTIPSRGASDSEVSNALKSMGLRVPPSLDNGGVAALAGIVAAITLMVQEAIACTDAAKLLKQHPDPSVLTVDDIRRRTTICLAQSDQAEADLKRTITNHFETSDDTRATGASVAALKWFQGWLNNLLST